MLEPGARPGLVRMMCGVAGSGKTTYARHLEALGFTSLSVDETIWRTVGRYGVDYPPREYERHQTSATRQVRRELVDGLAAGRCTVLDLSFWSRRDRASWTRLITEHGGRRELVHLQVDETTLRHRLARRAQRFDADAAFPVTPETLDRYLAGFQPPQGEGETVLCWADAGVDHP
ncbi:AAA family ATPase [Thalassiella azotivora]